MAKKTRPKKKAVSRKKAPRKKAAKPARKKVLRKPARHAAKPTRKSKKKARRAAPLSSVRFPGEDARYRKARDQLLKAEVELRRHTEAVAAERRKLPRGGELLEDYVFEESNKAGSSREVKFSELFAPDKHTLVLYNFMYGPQMARGCPSCSTMLDALDANAKAISQRVNLGVVAKSPLPRILSHARDRGWYALRLLSSAGNNYNRDYHGESPDGSQMPMLNVFVKRGANIYHLWGSELLHSPTDKGQDPRHGDFLFPLWSVFDLAPEGRGKDWRPQLSYF
ncbi:MAG TPA: DUF899 family protein [Gammaproteobacteria bacterium]|jgi:predicted dithiol-disulfide oxidoreductase (DUF899 family)